MKDYPIPGESGMTWEEDRQRAIAWLQTTPRRITEQNITDAMNELAARDYVIARGALTQEQIARFDAAAVRWRDLMAVMVFDDEPKVSGGDAGMGGGLT